MANSCTEFEVSSVCRCGDITWGVKFYYKGSPNPDHAPLYECNLVAVEGLECLYDPKSYAGGRVISW